MSPSTADKTVSHSLHPLALNPNKKTQDDIAHVVKEFFDKTYSAKILKKHVNSEKLEAVLRAETEALNLCSPQLDRTIHIAANMADRAYSGCTFPEKKSIALYTWYVIYVDDMATKYAAPFAAFQQRFLRGLPQLDPVLDAFASHLLKMCDQWDTFSANTLLNSTFRFVDGTCIEPAYETLPLIPGASRFPWFLRDRAGLSLAYAAMLFPKSRGVDFAVCSQIFPDINFWTSATNDILSFYKECVAGETANYIYNRAYAEAKYPMQVLSEIKDELVEARERITTALASSGSSDAMEVWQSFEEGYMAWHMAQDRYKLNDLDL